MYISNKTPTQKYSIDYYAGSIYRRGYTILFIKESYLMAKKYYWLKLQNDFFKRHDIRIIEDMPNGKDYILFYMKLLVESISHEGKLRFSETVPYNEGMLATITNTNIDIVRSAVKVFSELELMGFMDDGTFFMNETSNMLGEETEWAKKKRAYRENGGQKKTMSDKSIEKEIELDIDNTKVCSKKEQEFEVFWKAYKKPLKKKKAKQTYYNNKSLPAIEDHVKILEAWHKTESWKDGKYQPHATTWLNGERWNDAIPKDTSKPDQYNATENHVF